MSPAIEIQNLSKSYLVKKASGKESFKALNDLSFSIHPGEAVGIVGSNGAGKSTLLKILSQITYPSSGKAIINGRVASLLEVGTGFHPELSGMENIFLNGSILGLSRKEIKAKREEIIDFSGIEDFIHSPVKHYSSGMYVRLAFSVAAHLTSDILLMDEVLAVGDASFQRKCLQKMDATRNEDGRTVLFVSHNHNAIRQLCDTAIWLDHGKLKAQGSATDTTEQYLAELSGKANTVSLKDRTDRKGTQEVKITHLNFINTPLFSGTNTQLELHFSGKENVARLKFLLYIFKENGEFITGLDSEMSNYPFQQTSGNGKVVCHIPKLPLSEGNYYINANIDVNGIKSDRVERALNFKVHGGDYYNSGNSNFSRRQGVFIDQTWELNP